METTKSGRVVRSMNDMLKTEMIEDGEEEEGEEAEEEEEEDYDDINFGEGSRKKKVAGKRGSGSVQAAVCCQVEGCSADMSNCKTYHRRHKVCELHSKAPVVITGGCQQRFCQQCSRFHELLEFDDAKRSCRRRLAGHNERRRKTSFETYHRQPSS